MEWITALQRAIDYMEAHLMEEINYEDVAEAVHISSYEFHRAFSFLTGITANTYIRNRRATRSSYPRWAMRRRKRRTMKSILSVEEKVCFVNSGYRWRK